MGEYESSQKKINPQQIIATDYEIGIGDFEKK